MVYNGNSQDQLDDSGKIPLKWMVYCAKSEQQMDDLGGTMASTVPKWMIWGVLSHGGRPIAGWMVDFMENPVYKVNTMMNYVHDQFSIETYEFGDPHFRKPSYLFEMHFMTMFCLPGILQVG